MKKLKISTFNLFNLQLANKPMYRGKKWTEEEYKGKIDWTASILKKIDADIIGFQELWHPKALEEAFRVAGLLDEYELASTLTANSINVALAVKKPLNIVHKKWEPDMPHELRLKKSKKSYNNEPPYKIDVRIKKYSRPLLRANIKINDHLNITCFVTHLKSKLPMKIYKEPHYDEVKPHADAIGYALSSIRRASESAALRIVLNKEMQGNNRPVLLMGDLNDSQLSVTTSIISGDPKHKLFQKSGKGEKSDKGLYSVATMQELRSLRDVYYTYIHDGFRESLDHILVSEQFYDYSDNRIWSFEETRIINDHIDDKKGIGFGSDHGVVVSTFNYDPIE